MPEMIRLAGRRYTVTRRVDKICDTIAATGSRRLHDTVYLEIFAATDRATAVARRVASSTGRKRGFAASMFTPVRRTCARRGRGGPRAPRAPRDANRAGRRRRTEVWRCQATDALKASEPLKTSNLAQYWREFRNGNFGPLRFIWLLARAVRDGGGDRVGLLKPLPLEGAWHRSRAGGAARTSSPASLSRCDHRRRSRPRSTRPGTTAGSPSTARCSRTAGAPSASRTGWSGSSTTRRAACSRSPRTASSSTAPFARASAAPVAGSVRARSIPSGGRPGLSRVEEPEHTRSRERRRAGLPPDALDGAASDDS